jgi:hypothetical protein
MKPKQNSGSLQSRKTIKEDKQKNAVEELKALMEKGFKLGGIKIKSRDEIYDRRIFPN